LVRDPSAFEEQSADSLITVLKCEDRRRVIKLSGEEVPLSLMETIL
jgi:hypothetical protein